MRSRGSMQCGSWPCIWVRQFIGMVNFILLPLFVKKGKRVIDKRCQWQEEGGRSAFRAYLTDFFFAQMPTLKKCGPWPAPRIQLEMPSYIYSFQRPAPLSEAVHTFQMDMSHSQFMVPPHEVPCSILVKLGLQWVIKPLNSLGVILWNHTQILIFQ